ncbi:adaptin N terminal region-domain-containing protein [Armillaria novae-zelandiae]|uniref:Adaptin N terminal region-domain-containing protein n=1 Tax=Armillaria novae-zelandiae TaxID=153914 RepID=A0AA39PAU5_9AGAR|nr:adaptin N terminal region-domain-containing protein [Armillaria novae-zelandiae]
MQRPPNWVIGASATAAGVILTPIIASAALGIVGFGAAGPVAGTLAPVIQSGIGNVAAGSAFAVAQSMGMGGAIPAGVYAVSGAIAGVTGLAAGWFGDKKLIRKLDSGSDEQKLGAMRTLMARMDKGRDVSKYFAQVVKNVTSQIFEIRMLVYTYLLRYAGQEPELLLPFIDKFRRDLNDNDPLIQAMASHVLRVISRRRGGDEKGESEDGYSSDGSSKEGSA